VPNCDADWSLVQHDSFDETYRSPRGPLPLGSSLTLRLRTPKDALESVRLRLWDDRSNQERYLSLSQLETASEEAPFSWWSVTLPPAPWPTVLYYFFELRPRQGCGNALRYYTDDDTARTGGGRGVLLQKYDDWRSYQVTVYDPAFAVPAWATRATVYQIFPDRFRDGDASNNPRDRVVYGQKSLFRSGTEDWLAPLCDPRGQGAGACPGKFGENFYGGDLRGITEAIKRGYFSSLGVTVLYFNPIQRSPSNHHYDPLDFYDIDPSLGTLADWEELVRAAKERGIALVLDAVYNHVSSASPYFDRAHESPSLGACEDENSPYRDWFTFPGRTSPAREFGKDVFCAGGQSYDTFGGFSHLPKLNPASSGVRELLFQRKDSASLVWLARGASGFRLDAAGDLDPGPTGDPANDFWENFRATLKQNSTAREPWIIGETWGDGAPWLLGAEWDGFTNYRTRAMLLGFGATACSEGPGCEGGAFSDNDDNANSYAGPIRALVPSALHLRLLSQWEDTPAPGLLASMNLLGTHDTQRIATLLRLTNRDSAEKAQRRLAMLWLLFCALPGAPTVYYGDELALDAPGVWSGGVYEDDPYNRAPFPWEKAAPSLSAWRRAMSLRLGYRALQDGETEYGLVIDDAQGVYGLARHAKTGSAWVLVNQSERGARVRFAVARPEGSSVWEAISARRYTVENGTIDAEIAPESGAVFVEESGRDEPAAPVVRATKAGSAVELSWAPVYQDSRGEPELALRYEVFRRERGRGPMTKMAEITLPETPELVGPSLSWRDPNAAGRKHQYEVIAISATGAQSRAARASE
jgi:glycosidase